MLSKHFYFLIIILPLLGAIAAGLFGWLVGQNGARFLTLITVSSSFFLSLLLFFNLNSNTAFSSESIFKPGLDNEIYFNFFNWFQTERFNLNWSFQFDNLNSIMLIVVTGISLLVHWYSCYYMQGDPHLPRFMSYLSLFTFFMIILITADNLLVLFVGWEGIGLCSYLLISFWFTRLQAVKSAVKALLINRISDLGFMLGIISAFNIFQSGNFSVMFTLSPYVSDLTFSFYTYSFNAINVTCFFLFLGAVGKSAQIGLHTWLPDAMEGPTPVSALIHAATMVTAGVFLLIRCAPLFEYSPQILKFVIIFGTLTIFLGASIGIVQTDLKKVIAYSTCSQLGYMVLACGLSNYSAALFHLTNHAFFKALLFLAAGSIIHALTNEQDMRRMGGLATLLPVTFAVMTIGSFALQGIPFLAGFYSKDLIIEQSMVTYQDVALFGFWGATFSVGLTIWYSTRLVNLTFLESNQGYKLITIRAHENFEIILPLIILSVLSLISGYLFKDLLIGLGSNFLNLGVLTLPDNIHIIDCEFLHWGYKYLPFFYNFIFIFILGTGITFNTKSYFLNQIENFLINKWYFNDVYNFINQNTLIFSYKLFETFDKNLIESALIANFINKLWMFILLCHWSDHKITQTSLIYVDKLFSDI